MAECVLATMQGNFSLERTIGMKVAFISDIHIDDNCNYNVVEELCKCVNKNKAELLIIAGDISSNPFLTFRAIENIENQSGIEVLFVPGNHDMWNTETDDMSTDEIYDLMCKNTHCLCGRPKVLDKSVIIGDIGWYDYSFGDSTFSHYEFEKMSRNGRVWQDSLKNQWTKDNIGTCSWFLDRLESQMDEYKEMPQLLVTHMVPHEAFIVPKSRGDWAYFNAFLGTKKLEELFIKYPVHTAVFGHVHHRNNILDNDINWKCRCLNYYTEWDNEDCAQQIASAIDFMEL